jgi:ribosomal RNA-processing protein 1
VSNLRTYLRSRKEFSEIELLKLWKGLFYCMWMSDKPRNQQQLARDLADLIDVVPRTTLVPFVDAFWKTIAREWSGIGRLRYGFMNAGS